MALLCVISANSGSFRAHCVKVHVRYLISWWVLVVAWWCAAVLDVYMHCWLIFWLFAVSLQYVYNIDIAESFITLYSIKLHFTSWHSSLVRHNSYSKRTRGSDRPDPQSQPCRLTRLTKSNNFWMGGGESLLTVNKACRQKPECCQKSLKWYVYFFVIQSNQMSLFRENKVHEK